MRPSKISEDQPAVMPAMPECAKGGFMNKIRHLVGGCLLFMAAQGCGPGIRTASEQDIERAERTILARMGGGLGVSEDRQSAIGCMIIESDDPEKADDPDVDAKKIEAAMNSLRENNRKGLEAVNQRPLRTRDSNLDSQDLAFDRKGKATKKEACLQSAVEDTASDNPPAGIPEQPTRPEALSADVVEARQRLLNEYGYKAEGLQPDGRMVNFGEGNTMTESAINAIKKFPKGYLWDQQGMVKTKNGIVVTLLAGWSPEAKKPQPAPAPASQPTGKNEDCGFNGQEQAVFEILNKERVTNGLSSLACDPISTKVARDYSQDMCRRNFFSHTDPEGFTPMMRLIRGGAKLSASGENIARGQGTPERAHISWMNSDGHRKNILARNFEKVGIGHEYCDGRPFWTQLFIK